MTLRQALYLKVAFACASIALLLYFVPFGEIVTALADARVSWLVTGTLLQFVVRGAATFRMREIAGNQGLSLTRLQLYRILLATQFYAMLLPGLLAGGATWVKYVQHGAGKGAAAAVVVINRAIIVGVMVAAGTGAWVIDRPAVAPLAAAVIIASIAMTVAVLVLLPPLPARQAESAPPVTSIYGRLRGMLDRLLLILGLSRSAKLIVVASAFAESLLGAAVIYSFAIAVGAEISFLSALWVRAALMIMLLLPVTVAGIGVREASLVGLGALMGVPPSLAVAWSFTILMSTAVVAAAGAVIEANAAGGGISKVVDSAGSRRDA